MKTIEIVATCVGSLLAVLAIIVIYLTRLHNEITKEVEDLSCEE